MIYGYYMIDRKKELSEAIRASENVLDHLYAAEASLSHAKSWGILDIVGGGFISTYVKRDYMEEAQRELWAAKNAVVRLNMELDDVERMDNINIEMGDFLAFADYFFDGFFADWLVQARINDARDKIIDSINRLQGLRNYLVDRFNREP